VHDLDALLVDLDGCVWVGGRPLPGAVAALTRVQEAGIEVVYLTNDPGSTRDAHAQRLTALGLPTTADRVVTAGWALARTVARRHAGAATFVLGPPAMCDELASAGVTCVGLGDAQRAGVVAVGTDPQVRFEHLTAAVRAVLAGAAFYTANRDPWFPMPDGPWPSSGAFAAFVEHATGRVATAIGKPEPALYDAARALLPAASRIAAVGDRLDADVAGGRRAGLRTILVGPGRGEGPDPDDHLDALADVPALLGIGRTGGR
jgi:glycerol-1-phosphatase